MARDPFLLDILKKVMDLNSGVKETYYYPNLQVVRPQGNLKFLLMINHSNKMRCGSKIVKNNKSRVRSDYVWQDFSGLLFIFKIITFIAN